MGEIKTVDEQRRLESLNRPIEYDTTQFIVVTHRRGTMEEADILYGVTMQEKGISRLLRMEQPPADIEAE